ncbi:hypothetical protein CPB86DRAFT_716964 [Serendipita vermifera]|nr:hypothetical protein CPB86DRAFT_716964 [Serendipita vermifera]
MKDKEADKEDDKGPNTNEEKRPIRRSKLPSMRRNPSTVASTTSNVSTPPPSDKTSLSQPTTSSTSTILPAGPPRRKIVDAPPSGDVDLRNEDVFSQLFKKSGTGKADTRYDLTSSEKLEQQRIEMQKMKDAYLASRSSVRLCYDATVSGNLFLDNL